MKKALLVATALLIATPALSLAQDDHHHDGGGRPPAPAQPHAIPPASGGPQAHAGGSPAGAYRPGPPAQAAQGRSQPGGFPPANGNRGPGPGGPGYRGGGYPASGGERFARPTGQAYAGSPGARGGGQPFGFGGRQYFRYPAPPYRYPVGYYSWNNHTWRRGEWMPPVFASAAYYIDDWYDFGLWEPSYGYEWIRVGSNAVLINLADGQISDVVPGIYY